MSVPRPLAVSVGDPAGVGPAVVVEAVAAAAARGERFVVTGDAKVLFDAFVAHGVGSEDMAVAGANRGSREWRIRLEHVADWTEATMQTRAPSFEGGLAQRQGLDRAIDFVLEGAARALVTGPTSKEAIVLSGNAFTGQTEHLARRCGLRADEVTMLFLGPRLKVGLVTTHWAVREAVDVISEALVRRTIQHLRQALEHLGNSSATLVVSGLNPHAGESGLFGGEEAQSIAPACQGHAGVSLLGPVGAETAFRLAAEGKVDGVVTMLHDQATIASKLLDWKAAVNVTWGLPFVRTSVDHGVAYDAAREGKADAAGMTAAIQMAQALTSLKE